MNWFNFIDYVDKQDVIIREYNPQDIIFNEKSKCNMLGIILKGEIIISTITYNEKEEIFNIVSEGNVFGDLLVFSSDSTYLGDVIATRKTKVAFLTQNSLIKTFVNHPDLLRDFLQHIADKSISIKLQTKLLSHKNIEDRIMYYLNSKKNALNKVTLKSVTDLSKILSLPRPSVSRSLTILEDKGLIIRKNKDIYIM